MKSRALLFAVAALALSTPLSAQHMGAEGTHVLRAARMLDVTTGEITPNAVIVVEDGRIAAVNPASVPDVMHDVDLGDVTLLPGLIDAHTHLTGEPGSARPPF